MSIAELLNPKIDYVFKRVFGHTGSEDFTAEFISLILNEKIETINLDCNTFLEKNMADDKIGVLDIKVKYGDGVTCDVEMQVINTHNIYERLLFYWSKLYIQNIKSGSDYNVLKKCVVILIADFELDNLCDIPDYITRWKIMNEQYGKRILTDLLEFCIIELPKTNKFKTNNKLDDWVRFIKEPEVVDMSDENKNESIKKAKKVLQEISNDEQERYLAELREKYILDQNSIRAYGKEEGRSEGIKEGIETVAKEMLKQGTDIEYIAKVTKLSKEEIERLK